MRKVVYLISTILFMFLSQQTHALSVKSAVSGAVSTGTFGLVTEETLAGINDGLNPGSLLIAAWESDFFNLMDELGVTDNEFYNSVKADMTRIALEGLDTLGFDFISEELYWQSYMAFVSRVRKDATVITPSETFLQEFRSKYAKYFRTDISNITFFITPNPPDSNTAVADCMNIYFPASVNAVLLIKDGDLDAPDGLRHTFHELKHSDQCNDIGGRREYGIYWFKNIIATGAVNPEDLLEGINNSFDFTEFHDKMPMEIDAEQHAQSVLAANGENVATSRLVSPKQKLSAIIVMNSMLLH